ncbi:MAG: AMP-binding protein [Burkholderiales bacterium]|nr:AMP-binding protein [Burkholderiales bacterium]
MLGPVLRRALRAVLDIRLGAEQAGLFSSGPKLIVANHPGVLDPVLLASVLPRDVVVMASKASMRAGLTRLGLRGRAVETADLSEALSVRRIARLLARGRSVVVFPHNRPVPAGSTGKIYEAPAIVAVRTGVEIVPLHIRYGTGGAGGTPHDGVMIFAGAPTRIELPAGMPARERRRQATERLTQLMQDHAVAARPRRTLFGAFVDALHQQGRSRRIVEDIRQVEETYGSVLRISLALGRLLERASREGETVGVLLPNTVAAIGTVLGMSAVRRVPAMLNYSAGPDAVRSSADAAAIRTVITSRAFVEAARLERLLRALGHCRVYYLEDLREKFTARDKLWLGAWAQWRPRRAAKAADPGALALVLFTSGSEGRPKGVGLSHDAVLANMAQLAAAIDFGRSDKFLNALPMYHTYGLIACTLMPLFYGTRLFLYTNPLHYRIIPEIAYSRRCTYLFGTSTFLGNYARHARALDFHSLRYVISGGEKLTPEVQRLYQQRFGLRVLEGYGSTECGPAVSLATPHGFRPGSVGRFLPLVEHRLVPVAGIAEGGLLHVRSPNVMSGYFTLDEPGVLRPAGSELGADWHCMGDVVRIDADGFVSVLGRLQRFAKVAGEMVALEMVERLARECSPQHQHAATVALSPERGETTVLFTTDPALDRMALHQAARALGAQELAVARSIVHVDVLPVLGSGKTDYVTLAELARTAGDTPAPAPALGARA